VQDFHTSRGLFYLSVYSKKIWIDFFLLGVPKNPLDYSYNCSKTKSLNTSPIGGFVHGAKKNSVKWESPTAKETNTRKRLYLKNLNIQNLT
jgi:hypothetical protein